MSNVTQETKELAQETKASANADQSASDISAHTDKPAPVPEQTHEAHEGGKASAKTALEANLHELSWTEHPAQSKKSRKGIAVIVVIVVIVVLSVIASVYIFEAFGSSFGGLQMKNITEPPEGAEALVFMPIDPAEFASDINDDIVYVPDETGLELPSENDGNASSAPLIPKNHYAGAPNVSSFYQNAAQDESYVYFLQASSPEKKLANLMRMRILNGKVEPVTNANEINESIYSFTLFGQNMITCEYRQNTDTYAFYRVPKAFEDAQLLFEHESPAFMTAHDNKIFMLFASSRTLGVFDPAADTRPVLIDLPEDEENTRYLDEFSVINGYLYYGISYDESPRVKYLRRSLYTGETVTVLDSGETGATIWNPCWDDGGNAYYGQYEPDTGAYSLMMQKNGGSPEALSTFDFDGASLPLVAVGDEFIVAKIEPETICKYERGDFTPKLEAGEQGLPFAVTKDYIITSDGVYNIFDLSFTAF